ncbi:MFS general substrate transporter, partial [Viridothelium virens]
MSQEASWTRNSSIKGSTEAIRMALLTFSLIGLQFTWGTEMTYCTPYLLSLGLSKSKTSLVWIAGPISGLLVQPIVGILADKSRSRWGRRRPFMVGGAAIVCVCLFILGWTTEIIEFFAPDSKTQNQSRIILLAVLSIYGVDFAINAVQASCRSLIVDTLPIEKQQTGSAWATRMAAIGHVIGYILGSIDLHQIFGDFLGNTQFKQVVVVAALGLVLSVGVTSWAVTEKVLISDGTDTTDHDGPFAMFSQILRTTLNLPARMRIICWIQFWSWIGWFPFLFYSTTWVGEIYLRQNAKTSEGKVSDDALADIGRVGSTSLVIFSVIMLLGSLLIPLFVECPDDDTTFTSRLPPSPSQITAPTNKRKPSLLTAWTWSNILFALTLMATPFVSTMQSASFIVAICGLPWALAIWAPFAFMGVEINMLSSESIPYTSDRSPERPSIALVDSQLESIAKREHLLGDDRKGFEETAGVYLGILNLFTTLPQFVGTFVSMIVFRILEPGKDQELAHAIHIHRPSSGPNAIAVCMFIGGVSAFIASQLTRRL